MLNAAKKIEILNFDEIMKRFEFCYISDDIHIKNHSIMKTVISNVKTFDNKSIRLLMKISYLNMLLYKKLS